MLFHVIYVYELILSIQQLFEENETETQGDLKSSPRSHSQCVMMLIIKSRQPDSRALIQYTALGSGLYSPDPFGMG